MLDIRDDRRRGEERRGGWRRGEERRGRGREGEEGGEEGGEMLDIRDDSEGRYGLYLSQRLIACGELAAKPMALVLSGPTAGTSPAGAYPHCHTARG